VTGEAVIGYRAAVYDPDLAQAQPLIDKRTKMPFIWCLVTALVPKIWHNEIGGFDESMHSWEDVDYHWRMAKAGKCYLRVAEELVVVNFGSGSRRDRGLQDHRSLLDYVRGKYKEIEIKMCGCRGDRKSYKPVRSSVTPVTVGRGARLDSQQQEATMRDQDLVMARYLSPNKGKHRVVGSATRTDYGRRAGGNVFLVHQDDIRSQPHLFQPQEQAAPITAPAHPPPPPPPAPEPVAGTVIFDLQILPGVTPAIADGIRALGIVTKEDVLEAGLEGLMKVKGIGEAKAAVILGAAGTIEA